MARSPVICSVGILNNSKQARQVASKVGQILVRQLSCRDVFQRQNINMDFVEYGSEVCEVVYPRSRIELLLPQRGMMMKRAVVSLLQAL